MTDENKTPESKTASPAGGLADGSEPKTPNIDVWREATYSGVAPALFDFLHWLATHSRRLDDEVPGLAMRTEGGRRVTFVELNEPQRKRAVMHYLGIDPDAHAKELDAVLASLSDDCHLCNRPVVDHCPRCRRSGSYGCRNPSGVCLYHPDDLTGVFPAQRPITP